MKISRILRAHEDTQTKSQPHARGALFEPAENDVFHHHPHLSRWCSLGSMVLIVVLSVMEGLQIEMEKKGFALQPHYTATLSNAYTGATIPITMEDRKSVV